MSNHDGDGRDFTHAGIRYNVVYLRGQNRVQLWLQSAPGQPWKFDHGKTVPQGMTVGQVVHAMRQFVTGQIDHETYNAMLPGN